MVNIKEIKCKICLIGDWGVGKTSLIRKFVLDQFDDKYIVTFGTKVTKKRIKFKQDPQNIIDMNLVIWDVMGQKEFKKIQTSAYRGTHGVFLVCDITRLDTLKNLKKWQQEIFHVTGEIPLIVLVNKIDLKTKAKFTVEDVESAAKGLKAQFYLTSAKTGQNVESAFKNIGLKLL
jgi:small GTP-binding protein